MSDTDDSKPATSATLEALELAKRALANGAKSHGQRGSRRKKPGSPDSATELDRLDRAEEQKALPLPVNPLSKKQAMDWAEEQLDLHTPLAVQVVVGRLKNGTREERFNTAREILKGRGLYGEQGGRVGVGPTLVVFGIDPNNLPWGGTVKGKTVPSLQRADTSPGEVAPRATLADVRQYVEQFDRVSGSVADRPKLGADVVRADGAIGEGVK